MQNLFIVGLPIGNRKDITERAKEILESVDFVFAEDTREFNKLGLRVKNLRSFHNWNEREETKRIIELLKIHTVAIVSDRGMPVINDAGFLLVREYSKIGPIKIVPGVSAVTSSFVISGFSHRFCFLGFLTDKDWKVIHTIPYALVIFEGPHKLLCTLKMLYDTLGNRQVLIAKEITKPYEQFLYCQLGSIPAFEIKGEFTIVISP